MKPFEINCDMGEGTGNDAVLMPFLDACSIACGGHAGDKTSMLTTIQLAKQHHVKVGAHPSFPDRKNFGRKPLTMHKQELISSLQEQIWALKNICDNEGVRLDHIKPHGALYNLAAKEEATAEAVLEAIAGMELLLFAPWRSTLAKLAHDAGVQIQYEGFADRRYTQDLQLVSRDHPLAVIDDPEDAKKQVHSIATYHEVLTIERTRVEMHAATFCIHGDNPAAPVLAKALHDMSHDR